MRYALAVEYAGHAFCGFQSQPSRCGVQDALERAIGAIAGHPVTVSAAGRTDAGVHAVSQIVHFDTEGLTDEHVRAKKPALSLLLMLHAPQRGGGIALWDVLHSGADEATADELERPSTLVEYGVGELCVFDSYRLHQIQPFGGRRDRVSVTAHAAEVEPNQWEVWF